MRALRNRRKVDGVNILKIEVPDVEGRYHIIPKEITPRPDLEEYSMGEIIRRSILSETTPTMTEYLVQKLQYNVMTEWEDNIFLGNYVEVSDRNIYTSKFLKHLKSVTGKLPDKASPFSLEDYIKIFNSLRESTSPGTSIFTPTMVNMEVLYLELREIVWRRLNFPWCTDYSLNMYRRVLDLLIHIDPNDFRPHRLIPILLFDTKSNLHNKHNGNILTKTAE